VRQQIGAIVAVVRCWREHFHACGVSAHDIETIASAIFAAIHSS